MTAMPFNQPPANQPPRTAPLGASDRTHGWLLVGAQFSLLTVLVVLPDGRTWELADWLDDTLAMVDRLAVVAIAVAAAQLGTRLRIHPAPPRRFVLRTNGIYRWVRHPIYSAAIVVGAAIAARSGNPAHLVLWIALVAVLLLKARLEERLLLAGHPEYGHYMAATNRFLPSFKIWR